MGARDISFNITCGARSDAKLTHDFSRKTKARRRADVEYSQIHGGCYLRFRLLTTIPFFSARRRYHISPHSRARTCTFRLRRQMQRTLKSNNGERIVQISLLVLNPRAIYIFARCVWPYGLYYTFRGCSRSRRRCQNLKDLEYE